MLRNPTFSWLKSAFMFRKFGIVTMHLEKTSKKPTLFCVKNQIKNL